MQIRRSLYYSLGRTGGHTIIQFVANVILARLLLPSEIGVFAVGLGVIMSLNALRDFGISRYLIKEKDLSEDKIRTIFGVSILMSWSIAALIFAGRHQAAAFYGQPEISTVLAILPISFLLLPFGQPARDLLRREHRHDILARINILASLIGAITSVSLAALGKGPASMAYGALASEAVFSGLALFVRPDHLTLLPSLKEWRSVCGFGAVASLGAIAVQLAQQAPALLLGRLLGFAEVGFFVRAQGLIRLVSNLVVASTNHVTGAAMGAAHRSGQDMSALFLNTTSYIMVVIWPALIFAALNAKSIIVVIFGSAWLPAATLVPALCIANAINLLLSQATAVYEGTGAAGLHLRNTLLGLVASVGLLIVGAQFGLLEAAWSRVPAAVITFAIHYPMLRKFLGIKLIDIFRSLDRTILVSLGFGACLTALSIILADSVSNKVLDLFIKMIVMGPIYFGLIFLAKHPIRLELVQIARTLGGLERKRAN